jgi:hypothetical protein
MVLELCNFLVAYRSSSQEYQKELKKIWWIVFFMPLFRYLTYWFRLAGIIIASTETQSWKVESPIKQMLEAAKKNVKEIIQHRYRGANKDGVSITHKS